MVTTPTKTETERDEKGPGRPVAPGKVNVLVALLGLLLLAGAYWINLLPEALALMILTLSLLTAVAGGRSTLLSHHYSYATPYVRDALDFVRLVDGRGHDGDPERAESWYGFGEPVLAPADGTVVSVSDVHPDGPIGKTGVTPPYGNHITLKIGNHRYAVVAHLERGSARVSEGERVRVGQRIAAVGDSGNSLWPHLHFHVQDSPDLDQQARTVPVVFRDALLIRNGRGSTPAEADLRRGDHVRRIGD